MFGNLMTLLMVVLLIAVVLDVLIFECTNVLHFSKFCVSPSFMFVIECVFSCIHNTVVFGDSPNRGIPKTSVAEKRVARGSCVCCALCSSPGEFMLIGNPENANWSGKFIISFDFVSFLQFIQCNRYMIIRVQVICSHCTVGIDLKYYPIFSGPEYR